MLGRESDSSNTTSSSSQPMDVDAKFDDIDNASFQALIKVLDGELQNIARKINETPLNIVEEKQHPTTASHENILKNSLFALPPSSTQPIIPEADGKAMKCVPKHIFDNWGRTVHNIPAYTFIPKSKQGLMNLVKWANNNQKKIRVAGYRHTWGDFFSSNDEILVSLLDLDVAESLPARHPPLDRDNQLQGIEMVDASQGLCRIGAATTNEQFRQWCLGKATDPRTNKTGNKQWTIPLNVIMVEITWGGSNAPICHGAGINHKTLSDLVTEIEFINPLGQLQTVSDPDLIKSAAGCFGLLGIVTAITVKLDKMTYAHLKPTKQPLALTIPYLRDRDRSLPSDMFNISQEQQQSCEQRFITDCKKYYSEWFWFSLHEEGWTNCWDNDGKAENSQDYPTKLQVFMQEVGNLMAKYLNDSLFKALPEKCQAKAMSYLAMYALPTQEVTTTVSDALHFMRGIQNMRPVLDMEFEIPIPPTEVGGNQPDWSICQKAWWDAIEIVYRHSNNGKAPMRLALEMRITGGSDIKMAPQYGNSLGTCSIEVLTTGNTPTADWVAFMQEVADKWLSYTGPDGKPLAVRPHWAKQWREISYRDQDSISYMKSIYGHQMDQFKQAINQIAASGGYAFEDLTRRFSNNMLAELFDLSRPLLNTISSSSSIRRDIPADHKRGNDNVTEVADMQERSKRQKTDNEESSNNNLPDSSSSAPSTAMRR